MDSALCDRTLACLGQGAHLLQFH